METRHKNTTDRAKALTEQARQFNETIAKEREKIEADKAKNEQNHMRQVHAERRSRYIAAIEQLSNRENATTRLGGVYALIGLIDEWLADGALLTDKERRKESQAIINSLCAYIRSPFPLAERAEQLDGEYTKDLQNDFRGDTEKFDADKRGFSQDKATLEEERQVRQSIIKAIRERLQGFGAPGPWSNFDYDFSNTLFFYSTNFMFSHFDAFSYFHGVTFTQNADFSWAKFTGHADFSWAEFTGSTHFSSAIFADSASFSWAEFTGDAHFSGAEFTSANFSGATFEEKPIFERALGDKTYKARFSCKANPEDYNFEVSPASPYKIETEEQEHNGAKFIIPKGTELFDPDESSE